MTPKERAAYFGRLWPEACFANEWDVKDEAQRRAVTLECMRLIRVRPTDSTSKLGNDEVTALFVYLRHLADQASLEKSADWVSCQEDHRTFNRARQADWHERELYGTGKNKWDRNRFAGAATAAGSPLGTLDRKKTAHRHLTFATRHQKKLREEKKAAGAGQIVASQVPASVQESAPRRLALEARLFAAGSTFIKRATRDQMEWAVIAYVRGVVESRGHTHRWPITDEALLEEITRMVEDRARQEQQPAAVATFAGDSDLPF